MTKKKDAAAAAVADDTNPDSLAGIAVEEENPLAPGQPDPDAPKVPRPCDPGWHEFVMSHFLPDEVVTEDNKPCPRVNALWRVTELLMGEIVGYSCRVVKAPQDSRDKSCTVEATVEIENHLGLLRRYDGAADGSEYNIQEGFEKFTVAVTETRAKGRALRTALRLHKAIAAEERVVRPAAVEEAVLTSSQIFCLDTNAQRADVNVAKFIKAECVNHKVNFDEYGSISRLPREFGTKLCQLITKFQASGNTPPAVKGYDPNWRERRTL